MVYLCKSCGNKESFYQEGTETVWEKQFNRCTQYLDEEGEVTQSETGDTVDYGDTEYEDFESDGEVKCTECNSEVDDVSQEEWDDWEEGKGEDEQPNEEKTSKLKELKQQLTGGG
jgi:protein-arginine kinase activator protein McsA